MQIKRYRAENIQKAMQLIKQDLGNNAVIISTQNVKNGSGIFGLFGKNMVEVLAARDEEYEKDKKERLEEKFDERIDKVSLKKSSVKQAAKQTSRQTAKQPPIKKFVEETPAVSEEIDSEFENIFSENANSSPAYLTTQIIRSALEPLKDEIQTLKDELRSIKKNPQVSVIDTPPSIKAAPIKITESSKKSEKNTVTAINGYYERLKKSGVGDSIITHLTDKIKSNGTAGEEEIIDTLNAEIAEMINVSPDIKKQKGHPRIIALVGPTGVGKTTTLAKIAAKNIIDEKHSVAFITLDNYRVAAVEQLETYAKIIGAPIEVAHTPKELSQLIKKHRKTDMVLIDTVGRSQKDEQLIDDLSEFITTNEMIETHLVLSMTTREDILYEVIKNFSRIAIDKYIFTKLDESTSFGTMLNILVEKPLPVSFLTTGQRVPEDFLPASKEKICELILN